MPERLEMGGSFDLTPGLAYMNDEEAFENDPEENREVNVPLLRKTLEHITAHPEEWDQSNWARESETSPCGTAYCVAGQTVHSLGHQLVWNPGTNNASFCRVDGKLRTIQSAAAHALGITYDDAIRLFNALNDLNSLWEVASVLTNGEIEIPADLEARSGT